MTPKTSGRPGGIREIWLEKNLRWYFGTQLFSLAGQMLRSSLLSLFIIDAVGVKNAPPYVGAVWALNVMPGAFLGSIAGMFIDRYDKRKILQVTAVLGIIQALLLSIITLGDPHRVAMWQIVSVMAFTGLTNTVDAIGRNSIVKDAVTKRDNDRLAYITFTALYTIAMIVGNGMSGYLVLWIGYTPSFLLNGLSFIILIVGLRRMNFDHLSAKIAPKPGLSSMLHDVIVGVKYAFTAPGICTCILVSAAITIFGFAYNVITPVMAKAMFNGGPKEYSFLASTASFGSLVAAVIVIIWGAKAPKKFVVLGCLITGSAHLALSQTVNIHNGAIAMFFCGFGFMTAFLPIRGAMAHLIKESLISTMFLCGMYLDVKN